MIRFCLHRELSCPLANRRQCEHRSSIKQLMEHFDSEKCCNVISSISKQNKNEGGATDLHSDLQFVGHIQDHPTRPVMNFYTKRTVWKPNFLYSKTCIIAGGCCLFISRYFDKGLILFAQRCNKHNDH